MAVAVAFFAGRVIYRSLGVRFDWSTIAYFAQLLDPVVLRTRLAESIFYLHAQPPLYNLLTGIALKVAPDAPGRVLAPFFMACGLYTGVCLYVILVRLRVPVAAAAIVASAIVVSPPFVLYENWYFYPHLNVTWLVGATAWLAQSRGRPGREMAISAGHLGGLCLTRSFFHPAFFVAVAVSTVALVAPSVRRRALACFAIPGLLIFALCLKNQLEFGFFGSSSWASRNLLRSVTTLVGPARIRAETRLGHLSPAVTMDAFQPGDRTTAMFGLRLRPTGIPALDNVYKTDPSVNPTNFNHHSYPVSAHFAAGDVRDLVSAYPMTYLRGIWNISLPIFFHPVDGDGFVATNRRAILRAAQWFDDFDGADITHWVLAIGIGLALLTCLARSTGRHERLVLAFAFVALGWIVVLGAVGDVGENYRFRYKGLWLSWVVAAVGYCAAIRSVPAALRMLSALRSRPIPRRPRRTTGSPPGGG